MGPGKRIRIAMLAAALLCAGAYSHAAQSGNSHLPASANDFVRGIVQNELLQSSQGSSYYAFQQRTEKPRGTQVKQMVDTPQGIIGRMVSINDRPLTADERKKDEDRISRLLDPRQMSDKQKEQKEDEERTRQMVRSLPDAFLYDYAGTQPGPNGSEIVKLHFRPNPNFDPPSRETLVFQGMEGDMWIDTKARRIAKIDGTMTKGVSIGWGIIGHLDKGGRFLVEQGEVLPGHWDTKKLALDFTGKALIFKNIRIKSTDVFSDFRQVPPMNVSQALNYLRKPEEQVQNAANQNGSRKQ